MTHTQRISLSVLAGSLALAPSLLLGQSRDAAAPLYARGVQAYFAGRATDADTLLSSALADNSQDPRLYYFRALSLLRLGRLDEARGDMIVGARLEAQQPTRYAVGASLQRVQGAHRLLLEQYRRQARAGAAAVRARASRERQENVAVRDQEVLRAQVVVPLDELLRAEGPRALTAQELARRAAAAARPLAQARTTSEPAATAPVVTDDPFRDDAPAPADPVAASPPPQPEPPPAPEPTPPVEEAPDDDADEGDPFDF